MEDLPRTAAQFAQDAIHAGAIIGIGVAVALVAWLILWGIKGRIGAR